MEARFIGDPRNGGHGPSTLSLYGFTFRKDGEFVNVGENGKFAGHSHFETREGPLDHDHDGKKGGAVPKTEAELTAAEHRAAVIAELKALDVTFAKNAKTDVLEGLLAQAKAAPAEPKDDGQTRVELIAMLESAGITVDPNASVEDLEAALDAATKDAEA